MSLSGWIECKTFDEDEWSSAINIKAVADLYSIAELVGLRSSKFKPIVPIRSLPSDASYQVKENYAMDTEDIKMWKSLRKMLIKEFKKSTLPHPNVIYGSEEIQKFILDYLSKTNKSNCTWIIYDEFKKINLNNYFNKKESIKECKLIFRLMKALSDRYGNKNVRLIIWYNY